MGGFISPNSCLLSKDDEISNNINPGELRIAVANSFIPRNFSSNEYEGQHTSYQFNVVDYSAFGQKSGRAYTLRPYDTQQSMEHANKIRLSSDSLSSSSCLSDYSSFELGDLHSYDGLNKKPCDRYEIGLEILKAKLEFGADPKALSTHGDRSTLMFAVMANDFDLTKQLVERGVDVNQTNSSGETALSFAKELKHERIAKYLVSQGATEVPVADH